MLKSPAKRKLSETKITTLKPANAGFQINMKEKMAPKIPKTNNPPQFLFPYFLTSHAKLMDEIDRKRSKKPT